MLFRSTDFYIDFCSRFRKYFNADFVIIHDDWGTQRSAFFSPAVHKKMIIPHLTRFVKACHDMGLIVEQHSCGFIEELIPNLISSGIDTWAGQGICDKRKLINEYGDQFKFEVITNPKEPFTNMDDARQFALDIFSEFKDKNVAYWTSPRRCGSREAYEIISMAQEKAQATVDAASNQANAYVNAAKKYMDDAMEYLENVRKDVNLPLIANMTKLLVIASESKEELHEKVYEQTIDTLVDAILNLIFEKG